MSVNSFLDLWLYFDPKRVLVTFEAFLDNLTKTLYFQIKGWFAKCVVWQYIPRFSLVVIFIAWKKALTRIL